MRIVDDIQIGVVAADYERTLAEFAGEFGAIGLSLYAYGSLQAPASDLDLVVLVAPEYPRRRLPHLRHALDQFRRATPLREYLLVDSVQICASGTFPSVNYVHPAVRPEAFRLLSGAPVQLLGEAGSSRVARGVALVNDLLANVIELKALRARPAVGRRELASVLARLGRFIAPGLQSVTPLQAEQQDVVATAGEMATLLRRDLPLDQLGPNLAGSADAVTARVLQLLHDALDDSGSKVLSQWITITADAAEKVEVTGDIRLHVDPRVACHINAYPRFGGLATQMARMLQTRVDPPPWTTNGDEYRDLITHQMAVAADLERFADESGIPPFPFCLAGFWHTHTPSQGNASARAVQRLRGWVPSGLTAAGQWTQEGLARIRRGAEAIRPHADPGADAARAGSGHWPPIGHVRWGHLRRVAPISPNPFSRGLPIDRYYIEAFLRRHAADIRGRVLEIADATYTTQFGGDRVTKSDVLHSPEGNPGPHVTVLADLASGDGIESAAYDCVILTQTLPFIYDLHSTIKTVYRILRPGGTVLVTVPGITKVFGDEMEIWGQFWSFTTRSAEALFREQFMDSLVETKALGNILAATAFLHGLSTPELRPDELDHADPAYPVIVTVRAQRETD